MLNNRSIFKIKIPLLTGTKNQLAVSDVETIGKDIDYTGPQCPLPCQLSVTSKQLSLPIEYNGTAAKDNKGNRKPQNRLSYIEFQYDNRSLPVQNETSDTAIVPLSHTHQMPPRKPFKINYCDCRRTAPQLQTCCKQAKKFKVKDFGQAHGWCAAPPNAVGCSDGGKYAFTFHD